MKYINDSFFMLLKYLCKKYTKIIIWSCSCHIIDYQYHCYTFNEGPNNCVSLSNFFRHSCKITLMVCLQSKTPNVEWFQELFLLQTNLQFAVEIEHLVTVVLGDLFLRLFTLWFLRWGKAVVGTRRIVVGVTLHHIGVTKLVEVFSLDKNKIILNARYHSKQ